MLLNCHPAAVAPLVVDVGLFTLLFLLLSGGGEGPVRMRGRPSLDGGRVPGERGGWGEILLRVSFLQSFAVTVTPLGTALSSLFYHEVKN